MILDMGEVTHVGGVVTQARADQPWQYVKTFTVQYSSDGSTWQDVGGTFAGSSSVSKLVQLFPSVVQARYVKLVIQSWHYWISMRAGAIVCKVASRRLRGSMTSIPSFAVSRSLPDVDLGISQSASAPSWTSPSALVLLAILCVTLGLPCDARRGF